MKLDKIKFANVFITNVTLTDFLKHLNEGIIFTPNVDHVIRLQKSYDYYSIFNKADYFLCDSQILFWALKFTGLKPKQKISGSDFFPHFCNYHRRDSSIKIFMLGGKANAADLAKQKINSRIGRNIIVDSYSPTMGFESNESECDYIIKRINISGANVLVVGVGSPKQEKWIINNKMYLTDIKIFMAVGATIDFESGKIKRAPKIISRIGLEWLFRLLMDPKRLWKRYLIDDPSFIYLMLKQKLNLYKNPFEKELT